jgi:hypothetical protein
LGTRGPLGCPIARAVVRIGAAGGIDGEPDHNGRHGQGGHDRTEQQNSAFSSGVVRTERRWRPSWLNPDHRDLAIRFRVSPIIDRVHDISNRL